MLNIKPMGSIVAINTIFDRNIGGKKKVATSNSRYLAVLSSAASRNVLVSFQRYGYPKKALPPEKKFPPTLIPCIFYGKTKWNSL